MGYIVNKQGIIMDFSKRIMKVKPSPTLAVTALANSMKAKGIDIIGFGSGEPDFDTPRSIKDAAVRAIEAGKTKYTPAGGLPDLKKAVVDKFMRDNNLEYKLSEVTINCGGKHSFFNLMQVMLNEGDEVIIPAPYWVSYPSIVMLGGGEPVIIQTDAESGFKITPKQLQEKITKKTKAVVLNSPSNPTGAAYSKKEIEALGEVLEDKDLHIISDDIYESIIYDGFEFSNIANVSKKLKEKTIVLNGVSKTYSMTGWRIGYMAGDETIIKKTETLQSQSTSNPASISQWAAIEAINGDQSVVNEMVDAFTRRRKMVVESLNRIPGCNCLNPDGAFYVFPSFKGLFHSDSWKNLPAKYDSEFNSTNFSSYLLEAANVAVVPGVAFGNDDSIRMSFATSDKNIEEGVKRIKKAIEELG
jgi:aspartate aminotransferase